MRQIILDHIRCPECLGALEAEVFAANEDEITEGLLRCRSGKHVFPVVRSIPRLQAGGFQAEPEFAAHYAEELESFSVGAPSGKQRADRTARSFGIEWTTFQVQRPEEDLAYFRSKTGTDPQTLRGKLVLDAGCGSGRYARVVGEAGGTVLGVDLSVAVEAAYANTRHIPNVHIVQADVFHLPFEPHCFDFIYSIGVLHHTPNTRRALDCVVDLLAERGEIAIWLYPRWPAPVEIYNQLLRGITTRLPLEALYWFAVKVEPIGSIKLQLLTSNAGWRRAAGQLLRGLTIGVSYHPDREIRICDIFDWFSPPYQWHHTDKEVEGWLREYGFGEISNLSLGQEHYQYNYGNGVNFKARRMSVTSPSRSS